MPEEIRFYLQNKPYGFLSNFSPYAVFLKGKIWRTTEHYFQAQKFADTPHEEELRRASTVKEVAAMGRDRSRPLRPDWTDVRDQVMREALLAKFTQHPELREALIATGAARLVEHTRNDSYWADGGDGSGKNMLGILLMELREKL